MLGKLGKTASSFKRAASRLVVGNRKGARFSLVAPRFSAEPGAGLSLKSFLALWLEEPMRCSDARLRIGDEYFDVMLRPLLKSGETLEGLKVCRFGVDVGESELAGFGEENRIALVFLDGDDVRCERAVTYRAFRKRYKALHGPLLRLRDGGGELCAFFRQTRKNTLILTVRPCNVTDGLAARAKLRAAWLVSKLPTAHRPVLVFEKGVRQYAESGKAVFERLCSQGCDEVRYVVSEDQLPDEADVPQACRDKFIIAHTFKHYLAFFRARTFIGTEIPIHALERNSVSRLAYEHLNKPDRIWVFLQHGVMYMVSLDAFQRAFFRRASFGCKTLVSVNSEVEARHFVELGGYSPDEMLATGLAKFDFARQDDGADKIVVMPTWRPWEFALARADAANTGYWRMIERICDAIPLRLRDKVVVQAHPLFQGEARALADYAIDVRTGGSTADVDALLREAKVLVTDYSSVAYDAFYRGANVVFYWEELTECMTRYGAPAHLMIDEHSAFGFVCRTTEELASAVAEAYDCPQPVDHAKRFEGIVAYRDGRNTERLVDQLVQRGIIAPVAVERFRPKGESAFQQFGARAATRPEWSACP